MIADEVAQAIIETAADTAGQAANEADCDWVFIIRPRDADSDCVAITASSLPLAERNLLMLRLLKDEGYETFQPGDANAPGGKA